MCIRDRIRSIGDSGEAHAIPDLLSYAFAPNLDVQAEARSAIRNLFERLPQEQLPALDEGLRAAWAHVEDWYGVKPSVKKLKGHDPDDLVLLALMSTHRSGYVRAEAIHSLGKDSSGTAIPFLLLRLVDWVEAVRRAADLELIDKLQPQYGGIFVRCLGPVSYTHLDVYKRQVERRARLSSQRLAAVTTFLRCRRMKKIGSG